jgi:hypothetical protein
MILGIQIVGVLFGALMLYLTFMHQKRREFSANESLFWGALWLGLIFITVLPKSLNFLVKDILQVSRPLDFFVITGVLVTVGVAFNCYARMRKLQEKMESLVRKLAVEKK